MKTPKEYAEQLVLKYIQFTMKWFPEIDWQKDIDDAKQCALIAVDEIINAIHFDWMEEQNLESQIRFYDEVKKEIELL